MDKKILLINDMAGYGKVALSAMIPILSYLKYQIFNLPTALVSNTLNYGKFEILETTPYMKNTLKVWDELGFSFDVISTGFLFSTAQTKLVYDFCKTQKEKGSLIIVDPIMGDDLKLYNGVSKENVSYMQKIIKIGDVIMPNFTEATFISNYLIGQRVISKDEAKSLVYKLKKQGAKNIIITSTNIEDEMHTIVYDYNNDKIYFNKYEEIPVSFPGTGDIFSSVFISEYLKNNDLNNSCIKAMNVVKKMIALNINNVDKFKGIPLELHLDLLDED